MTDKVITIISLLKTQEHIKELSNKYGYDLTVLIEEIDKIIRNLDKYVKEENKNED